MRAELCWCWLEIDCSELNEKLSDRTLLNALVWLLFLCLALKEYSDEVRMWFGEVVRMSFVGKADLKNPAREQYI